MNDEPRAEEPEAPNWQEFIRIARWPIAVVVTVLIVGGILPFVFSGTWANAASFGDSFGFVNAVFSGLALAGVVAAIVLQSQQLKMQSHELGLQIEELKLQREELRLTRDELKLSREAQQKSEEALSEQVKYLFLTAYINGTAATVKYYSTRMQLSGFEKHGARTHWQFKEAIAIQDVTSLIERINPLLPDILREVPLRPAHVVEKLETIADYFGSQIADRSDDPLEWTRSCQRALVEVLRQMESMLSVVRTIDLRDEIVGEKERLETTLRNTFTGGILTVQGTKALEEGRDNLRSCINRLRVMAESLDSA